MKNIDQIKTLIASLTAGVDCGAISGSAPDIVAHLSTAVSDLSTDVTAENATNSNTIAELQTALSAAQEKAQADKTAFEANLAEVSALLQDRDTKIVGLQVMLDSLSKQLADKTKECTDAATKLTENDSEIGTIRANTKKAITAAAQYLKALTETELSDAQQLAVSGLGGVLAFAAKSELQRQYDAALAAAAEAQARANELAAKLQT